MPLVSGDFDQMVENPFTQMASNPAKLDRCVKKVKAKGGARNPYAVCNAAIGGVLLLALPGCGVTEWFQADPEAATATLQGTGLAVGTAFGGPVGAGIGQIGGTLAAAVFATIGGNKARKVMQARGKKKLEAAVKAVNGSGTPA